MWLLRNDSKGLVYRVTPGKQHIVTRKDGDLLLLGDQSISRKHAILQVDENEADGIILKDMGSKYGTFTIIGEGDLVQLPPNQQTTLRNGDSVKFGIQWNCWRAEFIDLLVSHSTLTQEEKTELNQVVGSLGGRVVNDWQVDCTHLTMNKLTVTIKVVCALATAKPIVTPSYWRNLSQSLMKMETTLPDCKDFLPPLAEAMLNPSEVSFLPNSARSKLFQGCTFVAASNKQLGRIRPMITAAGGNVVEFSARLWTEEKLLKEKTILMLSSASDRQGSQQSQIFDGYIPTARKLKSKGVRCIPESEIGLSVLYCSMSQYCNPRFNNQSLVNSSGSGEEATQRVNVICANTEESMSVDQDNIDTIPGPVAQSNSKKRALRDLNGDQEPLSKRPDLKKNSEDLFSSQHANNSKTNIETSLSPKPQANKVQQEPARINPVPSLDMFAPSGERSGPSNEQKQNVLPPSCEDMFASTGSRRQGSRDLASDEFTFPRARNTKESSGNINDIDEFSFEKTRHSKRIRIESDNAVDEFSFKSVKSSIVTPNSETKNEDLFSFESAKRPNERNRHSNSDLFASSAESSIVNDDCIPGPSKAVDNFSFRSSKPNVCEDNLFAFPDDHNSKRRRVSGQVLDLNSTGCEIKLALLNKKCETESGPVSIEQELEEPAEPKNLITYSKANNLPTKVKEELGNEEIDELARELFNATVVVVKPLLVAREKHPERSAPEFTGKNFKKFHKVVGINKRIVPHIIGGSDLIPHYDVGKNFERDSSPVHAVNDDDVDDEWAFDKKKANKRIH